MRKFTNSVSVLTLAVLLLTTLATSQTQAQEVRPYCGLIEVFESEQLIDGKPGRYSGIGSFVIIDDNTVLTNEHNVRDYLAERSRNNKDNWITLYFYDKSKQPGEVVAVSKKYDLALVSFPKLPKGAHRIGVADQQASVSVTVAGFPGGKFENYLEQVKSEFYADNRFDYAFKFPGLYRVGYSGSPIIDSEGYLTGLLWGCDFDPERPVDDQGPIFGYGTRLEFIREFLAENKILAE